MSFLSMHPASPVASRLAASRSRPSETSSAEPRVAVGRAIRRECGSFGSGML
jgi:hypothetical protein